MADETDQIPDEAPEAEDTPTAPELLTGHAAEAVKAVYAQTNSMGEMMATNIRQIKILRSMAAYAEDEKLGQMLEMIEHQYQSVHTVLQTAQQAIAAQSAPQNQPTD